MILRKDGVFTAVTSAGETVHINSFKRVRHEYNDKVGFYEVEDKLRLLMDENGRPVNCIEKGNYQIIDGEILIDAVSSEPNAI
ncbi:MAG: hypothetical protein K0U86_17670 [Planctomycetes bacterium]|nr:hypothetical protein [Planctomycetota bacterium]MCH9726735.1 hypothetical protein [Planctomycetota bacterium]MCH9779643.1 hypothetical protein [Planctomycetota bacterium]MDF1744107.1 hypothetical protein [Gimesia sp.]